MKWSVVSSPALLILYLVTLSSAEESKGKTPVDLKVPLTSTLDTASLNGTKWKKCPDGMICWSTFTCCPWRSPRMYSCCPLTNAVCCPDLKHCCPEGQSCSADLKCIPEHRFH